MTDVVLHTLHERQCGCRSYHARSKVHETWTYDYCIKELSMSRHAAKLAMLFFTASFATQHAPQA